MNPAVYRASALLIAAATSHGPGDEDAEAERARVSAAMKIIRQLTPHAGSYRTRPIGSSPTGRTPSG